MSEWSEMDVVVCGGEVGEWMSGGVSEDLVEWSGCGGVEWR